MKNNYYVRFVTKSQAHRVRPLRGSHGEPVRDRQSLHRPECNKEKIKEYNKKRVLWGRQKFLSPLWCEVSLHPHVLVA